MADHTACTHSPELPEWLHSVRQPSTCSSLRLKQLEMAPNSSRSFCTPDEFGCMVMRVQGSQPIFQLLICCQEVIVLPINTSSSRVAVLARPQGGSIQNPRTEYFSILHDPKGIII